MEHLCLAGTKFYIIGLGHMIKPCPYLVKNLKIFFPGTISQMTLTIGTQQKGLERNKVYLNNDLDLFYNKANCSFRLLHWKMPSILLNSPSETTGLIEDRFYMKQLCLDGTKV